jgi:hypothetical protein
MKIAMIGDFQILKKQGKEFVPQTFDNVKCMSIGGYSFDVNGDSIPFDWDAFTATEENGVFSFTTGKGPFFNDYEIPDYWDEEYNEIGITREEITAEFLASVSHIEDFFVNFDDSDGKEHGIGWFADNVNSSQYKVNILDLAFVNVETADEHPVSKEVINRYNKGEYNG